MKNLLYRRNNTNPQKDVNPEEHLQRPHPITGTAERYSLYDHFHQKNQTRPEEVLRSLNLVPDLCSFVNSSEAEQKNRELSFDRYFLCQMKETHFLFCTRLVFHLHNDHINQTFIKKMETQTKENLQIGPDGRLRLTSTEMSAPGGKVDVEMTVQHNVMAKNSFSIGQFPIQEEHKAKLLELYKAPATDYAIVQVDQALVYLADLLSICPQPLLEDDLHTSYPWLTDDAVNARVLQLARPLQNVFTLQTFHFTAWWRNWINGESISSRHLHCIQGLKPDSKVLFPRVVGHQTPETGNHFILWVFDGSKTEIRVYDSLEKYTLISQPDMDILSLAFQNIWRLKEWSISYPDQWRQKDGVNCGVFVCTAAELDIKGTDMTNEPLNQVQLGHLRMYHAACLIADSVPKGKKVRESCMAEAIHACNYYDSTRKGQSRPLYPHVQKEDWVKCETCNGWLHKDCACYEPSQSGIFTCGCDLPEPYAFTSTLTSLRDKGVEGLISKERIKELKEMLDSGERKSNRMFLWQNPGGNRALKTILNGKPTCFNEKHMNDLIDLIKPTLSLDYSLFSNIDFVIDVMVPEATIDILVRFEGFSRFYAEKILGTIIE
ncbi:uncharacterized protein LOC120547622 [Perca fluviatilis]|nr:uncharacterized protein LOC120547622 [Perca fluviatilis]